MEVLEIVSVFHAVGNAWPLIRAQRLPNDMKADCPLDGWGNTSLSLIAVLSDERKFHVLVDFGAGAYAGMMRSNAPMPDLIVCTHGHPDHVSKMEMDTIARALDGKVIPIVTSQVTYEMLPSFQRAKFQHCAISAREEAKVTTGIEGFEVTIKAIDSEAHFKGALMYVITIGGFRVGCLFDLKNWDGIDRECVQDLDLAIIEANSIANLSKKTGHVSVIQNIEFLRSLHRKRGPRLTLFTHFGFDDTQILSDGSLISLIAGIAPDLSIRVAYKGMTISSKWLPPRNPVTLLDEATNQVIGVSEKKVAHDDRLLHGSTMILVRTKPGRLLVYKRDAKQSYPNLLDSFGGHMQPDDGGDPKRTAIREGREEILLYTPDGLPVMLSDDWLIQFGEAFSLETDKKNKNCERSTVFGLSVPEGLIIKARDEREDGSEVDLVVHTATLDELLTKLNSEPPELADGLQRVLSGISLDLDFRAAVESFLS